MKKAIILIIVGVSMFSCERESDKRDGLMLEDPKTKKRYMLEHRIGVVYAVREEQVVISGSDTTTVFK